jgi:hypothetical protein
MSTREIIAELPRLTLDELHAIEQRIAELTAELNSLLSPGAVTELHAERIGERLVLAGPRVVRQTEVEAILDEFP